MFTKKIITKGRTALALIAVPFLMPLSVYGEQIVSASSASVVVPSCQRDVHSAGNWNIDLNYPGAGIRYFPAAGRALEALGQAQDRVFTGTLRYYVYPAGLAREPVFPYFAIEGDYLKFKGSYSKGSGWGGGAYCGVEYFAWRAVSLQTELGGMFVSVKDKDTSLTQGGLEFVLNFGINIYFGVGKK